MIEIHLIDGQAIYVESRTVSEFGPIPPNVVFVDPPEIVSPQVAQWNGGGWEVLAERPEPLKPSAESLLVAAVTSLIRRIDADADSVYASAVGNRTTEYQKAEAQARSFRDAGYVGAAPKAVASWANATGKSAQWAADDIIATADAWNTAEDAIREARLMCKESARNAQTEADLEMVRSQWSALLVQIRAQLGE